MIILKLTSREMCMDVASMVLSGENIPGCLRVSLSLRTLRYRWVAMGVPGAHQLPRGKQSFLKTAKI